MGIKDIFTCISHVGVGPRGLRRRNKKSTEGASEEQKMSSPSAIDINNRPERDGVHGETGGHEMGGDGSSSRSPFLFAPDNPGDVPPNPNEEPDVGSDNELGEKSGPSGTAGEDSGPSGAAPASARREATAGEDLILEEALRDGFVLGDIWDNEHALKGTIEDDQKYSQIFGRPPAPVESFQQNKKVLFCWRNLSNQKNRQTFLITLSDFFR